MPLSAVLFPQGKELGAVAKFHKRGKRTLPKEMAIIVRSVAKPASDVLIFGLTNTNGEIEPPTRSHQDSNDDEGQQYFYRKLLSEVR